MRKLFGHQSRPLIVAHRGACGLLPEQTLPAFSLAIEQGADAIELDVVPTRDRVLVARHESELSLTTNVADDPRFSSRRTKSRIDGAPVTGWFTTDFTFAEVRSLRTRERLPFRDRASDGMFPVAVLDEVLELAAARNVIVFIEVKHPAHFASLGFPMDELLLEVLSRRHAFCRDHVVVQSFDSEFLRRLRGRTELPIIQLLETPDSELEKIATYADGIGPWKRLIVPAPTAEDGLADSRPPKLLPPTSLVADAHARGLFVSAWTFRNEPQFLAADYGADPIREYRHFMELGVDALTTDFPGTAVAARAIKSEK